MDILKIMNGIRSFFKNLLKIILGYFKFVFNFAILTGVPPVSHVSCAVVLRHITLNFAYKQNSFGAACFCIFFIFFLYLPQRVAVASA